MYRVLALVAVFLIPSIASAQFYSGEPKWDFAVGATYQNSLSAGGGNGSSLSVDGELGFSVSINYNFNSRFALGADFDWLRPDYRAVLVNDEDPTESLNISHTASQWNSRIKGRFNFVKEGPLVPYAQLGIGWTFLDSNVADGPPVTGCWWHPWWGYICENFYQTYSSTEFSYGGALGIRYELPGNSYINLSYDYWELDTGGSRANPSFDSWRLQYGWRF
ncbi:MAG: porin family protein [Woeseiaceae bacterium]|jgi:opacity protein-like surface antigen|nr:porin family protein [Woeseiaceae bacterium]